MPFDMTNATNLLMPTVREKFAKGTTLRDMRRWLRTHTTRTEREAILTDLYGRVY